MPIRPSDEALTEQFYAWEKRGRGWSMFDYPVGLEPPFRPFWGHYLAPEPVRADEARRPSFFGAIVETLRGEAPRQASSLAQEFDENIVEPDVEPFAYGGPLGEIEVRLRRGLSVSGG